MTSKQSDDRTWTRHTLAPGFWVALTLAPDTAPSRCYVGQIQTIDAHGARITLIDWINGRSVGWDLYVPWANILSALVATPDHDIENFGKSAAKWQEHWTTERQAKP
jgi:hypothetical protein